MVTGEEPGGVELQGYVEGPASIVGAESVVTSSQKIQKRLLLEHPYETRAAPLSEMAELALSVAGVALAFKGAIDTALFIKAFHDERNLDCGYLALRYHVEQTQLRQWGEYLNVDQGARQEQSTLHDRPEINELIIKILNEFERLNIEAEKLVVKNDIGMRENADTLKKARTRFRWTITGKASFEAVVDQMQKLNESLYRLTLGSVQSKALAESRASRVLISIDDPALLNILRNSGVFDRTLSRSANVKSHTSAEPQDSDPVAQPTFIGAREIKFYNGSDDSGSLQRANGAMLPSWIEWNVIAPGTSMQEYVRRIHILAGLLEQVSDPAIRLPPCYGVYDDRDYEARYGARRLGYVFGLPSQDCDVDIITHRPQVLRDLISKCPPSRIPLLGDRFRLAQALAVAFSRFHSAGWLHKGLHTSSIVFFQRKDTRNISLMDPFITGFQYSRPQGEASLSRGPLENDNLQYYYHPGSERHFTRKIDLYSLGVVLYEIGRWALVNETASDSRRSKLTDRESWHQYVMKISEQELGWRVGKNYHDAVATLLKGDLQDDDDVLFSQQYFSRVIEPLQACVA